MADFQQNLQMAQTIAREVDSRGGCAYYVGGYVRDLLMGKQNEDLDMEIHGISPGDLEGILDSLGERLTIGECFGIYAMRGYSLDIAMPRKEESRGAGHRDFAVSVDPFIGTEAAARRRDFTINAMMQNVLTGELLDPFGGRRDLETGMIRHIDPVSFPEDPLRVLRAAQFSSRLGFAVAEETVSLCRGISLSDLPKERILGELNKALLQAERPSVFFAVLRRMDQLSLWFPELEALIGLEQNPRFHPEGDVWTHTMLVLDNAAGDRDLVQDPEALLLAALCHDMGKAVCTEKISGVIHAYGHEVKGLPVIRSFLSRLTGERALIRTVLNLCEYHMKPNRMAADRASVKATNHMFDRSEDPQALIRLAIADGMSSGATPEMEYCERFLYDRLKTYRQTMAEPFVAGDDLIRAGLEPGPRFTEYLAYAHKLRLAGIEKECALKQTLAYARTH